jgi:hypothetical protein
MNSNSSSPLLSLYLKQTINKEMKRKTFHVLNRKGASIWEKIDTKTILVKTTKNDDDEKNEKNSK